MARGWESKAIEEQQSQATVPRSGAKQKLTPEQSALRQQKEGLQLARKRILNQLQTVQNERHRQMLKDALADLDARINH